MVNKDWVTRSKPSDSQNCWEINFNFPSKKFGPVHRAEFKDFLKEGCSITFNDRIYTINGHSNEWYHSITKIQDENFHLIFKWLGKTFYVIIVVVDTSKPKYQIEMVKYWVCSCKGDDYILQNENNIVLSNDDVPNITTVWKLANGQAIEEKNIRDLQEKTHGKQCNIAFSLIDNCLCAATKQGKQFKKVLLCHDRYTVVLPKKF